MGGPQLFIDSGSMDKSSGGRSLMLILLAMVAVLAAIVSLALWAAP